MLLAVLGPVLLASSIAPVTAQIVVQVDKTANHVIPTTLYGQMFEDIGHSGDGGLYAELLQNRAFQEVTPNSSAALLAWAPVGDAQISVTAGPEPVSSALPNSLKLVVPNNATGPAGFGNAGYFGINVNASWTYNVSFYYKVVNPPISGGSGSLDLNASLVSFTTDSTLGSVSTALSTAQSTWTRVQLQFTPHTDGSDINNHFTLTLDGASAQGAVLEFALLSLFPPTFEGRENGMRIDLAHALADMKPAFFRFPGGNNLEGQTVATRWQWNATVGPLLDRPGRQGDWGYVNTDGLGLMEYLLWCEDLDMVPIMGVWDGYTIGQNTVPENELAPYIQQAIDQINFVVGDPSESAPAALRASLGRTEPFNLTYVEIGNEDFISTPATTTAPYRWRDFYGNLSAAFPQLSFIATTDSFQPILEPTPKFYDVHRYDTPQWFATNSFYYDDFERNGTLYFEGEYAAELDGFPTMQSAASEAAFMTGFERNADIVFAASYAPLIQNLATNPATEPNAHGVRNLIDFDASTIVRTTSYYVQQMFSLNAGDEYLPSTLPNRTGNIFWSVTRRTSTDELLFKIANVNAETLNLTFALSSDFMQVASTGTATVLAGAAGATASNAPDAPDDVVPVTSMFEVDAEGLQVQWTAVGWSVAVLSVVAS